MNWMAKISLVLISTLLFSTFMFDGFFNPRQAQAVITELQGWTNVYHNAAYPGTITQFPVNAGSERVLVVAIASTATAATTQTITSVTYDGVAMTLAAGDGASNIPQHTYLYYLKDNAVMNGFNKTLSVSMSGGTSQVTDVYYSVFTGVDQTTPLTDAKNGNASNASSISFSTNLTVNTNDQAVKVFNSTRLGKAAASISNFGTNWILSTEQVFAGTDGIRTAVGNFSIPTSNTTDPGTVTIAGKTEQSLTGLSLKVSTADSTPAVVTNIQVNPTVSTFTTGSPTITADLSDPQSTVTLCEYYTDGSTWVSGVVSGSGPWVCTGSPTGLSGTLNINVRAKSNAPWSTPGANLTRTVDVTAPTTPDPQSSSAWQATEKTVTLTPNDGTGVGVTAATGIYGCFGSGCSPAVLGGTTMTTACGAGNECSYAVRYYSIDNLNNNESLQTSTKESLYLARIDRKAPVNLNNSSPAEGAGDLPHLTTTVSSTTATDAGSGGVEYYFEVSDGVLPGGNIQTGGWQAGTTFAPTLAEGLPYTWHVKARDALLNETGYTTTRTFSTLAPCTRNNPTLLFQTTTGVIQENGGTEVYVLQVDNNDDGGCGNTVFNLSVSDTDPGNNYEPPQLASSTADLAPHGQALINVTVTATPDKLSGQTLTTAYSAADANHSAASTATPATTNLNVIECNLNTPYLVIGPNSGNVAIGGDIDYTITVQNTDTGAGCESFTYNIAISNETNAPTANFNSSVLSEPSKTLNAGQKGSVTLTVSSPLGATLEEVNITTISVTEASHTSPTDGLVTTTVGNPILHNSINTGSSKWAGAGGWGIPSAKYGEFDCETCHTPNDTTNIKKIRTSIVTPSATLGTLPGDSQPIVFTQVASTTGASGVFGDDSDTNPSGRTSSNRICEVCHTYDPGQVNGVSVHVYNSSGTDLGNHQGANAADCVGCHKHNKGFMPPACNACHGDPPGALASGAEATGSVTAGAHVLHATTLSYTCNTCHGTVYTMPEETTVPALIGKNDIDIAFSAFGSATGTYTGQTGVSYNQVEGTGGLTCSAVYCHGSTLDGTNKTPAWNGSVSCGNCHLATAGTPPTLGSHPRHAGNGAGQLALACSACHGANGAGGAGHVGGTVQWSLNTASATFGAGAQYNSAASGTISNRAPSPSYQTCSTLYCHSNAQGANGSGVPSSYKTPTWGGSVNCGSCHNDMSGGTGTGSHVKHANTYGINCSNCHTGYTASTTNSTLHANYSINVTVTSGTYSSSATPGDGYGSCSTTNCHSDGKAAPSTYTNPAWGGSAACGTCHGVTAAAPPASALHTKHVGTADNYKYACYKCHANVSVTADSTTSATLNGTYTTTHVNNTRNVDFNVTSVGGSWSGTQCSNTYCHSAGTTFTVAAATHSAISWSGSMTCASCHTGGTTTGPNYANNSPKKNTHAQHVTTSGYACVACHSGTVTSSNTIFDTSKHLNIAYDVSGAKLTNYTYAADGGTCATSCHGSGTPKWGAQVTSATCVKCHGIAGSSAGQYTAELNRAAPGYTSGTAPMGPGVDTQGLAGTVSSNVSNNTKVGAHDVHLRGIGGYASGAALTACTDCHTVSAVSDANHMSGSTTFTWSTKVTSSGALSPSYAGGGGACTNTYCHGNAFPAAVKGTDLAPTWTGGTYLANPAASKNSTDCNKCHVSPPTSSAKFAHTAMTISTNCASCHNHNGTGATHINGILYGAGDCDSCHSFDVVGATYASSVWTGGTWGSGGHQDTPVDEGWGAHAVHINHIKTKLVITGVLSPTGQTFGTGVPANVCGTCHTNLDGNHQDTSRQILFGDGTYKYGGAGGTSFVFGASNPAYNGTSGVSSGTTAKTCSNISCHFSTTPTWAAY